MSLLSLTRHGDRPDPGACRDCLPEEVRHELASLSLARDLEALAQRRLSEAARRGPHAGYPHP